MVGEGTDRVEAVEDGVPFKTECAAHHKHTKQKPHQASIKLRDLEARTTAPEWPGTESRSGAPDHADDLDEDEGDTHGDVAVGGDDLDGEPKQHDDHDPDGREQLPVLAAFEPPLGPHPEVPVERLLGTALPTSAGDIDIADSINSSCRTREEREQIVLEEGTRHSLPVRPAAHSKRSRQFSGGLHWMHRSTRQTQTAKGSALLQFRIDANVQT